MPAPMIDDRWPPFETPYAMKRRKLEEQKERIEQKRREEADKKFNEKIIEKLREQIRELGEEPCE